MKPKSALRTFLFLAGCTLLTAPSILAQTTYTWSQTASGNWTTATNWTPNAVPSPVSGDIIDFTTINAASPTVTLGADRTAEIWKFGDTSGVSVWKIATGNSIILAGATPTVQVDAGNRLEMSNPISGTNGLIKSGGGVFILVSGGTSTAPTSAYTGATSVTGGILDFGTITNANIGGGVGVRDITVSSGAAVRFTALSNTFLNRIVQTSDEFAVMTGTTSNALDFSSATGANLPNAFLSNYLSNGGKTEISGILTFGNGNYRLGAPGQSGVLGIRQASLLSGSNGLIVGGNRVEIAGTHTFTGDTVIRDGARLGLAGLNADVGAAKNHSLGLQNSVLDLAAPSATGQIFLEAGVGGQVADSTTLANGGTTSATFGGLKGSRNLNSAFLFTNPGNNTAAATATAITGFTLNVGTGTTATYSGAIGGFGTGASGGLNGASTLTKTGDGKQILGGTNTYTGATSVNGGTLEIAAGGSTAAGSAVTVSNSGSELVVNGTVNGTLLANASTTVSGTGTVVGSATIQGTHNPGNSPGIQTLSSNLAYSGGASVVNWELSANTASNLANPNAVFDQIIVGGNLDFTNLTALNLSFAVAGSNVLWGDTLWDAAQSWTLYDVAGTTTNFSNLSINTINWLDSGSNLFSTTGGSFSLTQNGNDVVLNYAVVPEPRAALLGGLGLLALLRRRR